MILSIFVPMGALHYIQVLLPLKLDWTPWYSTEEEVHVGQRVTVFFARRQQTGVVVSVDGKPDIDPSKIARITSTDTGLPDITEGELKLWEFVAQYYMCTLGEVYKAAYPGLKIRSEKVAADHQKRSAATRVRMEMALRRKVESLEKRLAQKEKALAGKHRDDITARLESERDAVSAQLATARAALEAFLGSDPQLELCGGMAKRPCDPSFKPGKPVLVRGSKRLSEYFGYVRRALDAGKDVLVLEPETDFGYNVEADFKEQFKDSLRIYNATLTPVGRRKVADELRSEDREPLVVLGLRSALFLPWENLGLVIVDEEQDSSYKQTEPAPRYNGRDVAAVLAANCKAQLVLGSGCPSLETLLNCISGKYSVVDIADDTVEVDIIDIPSEKRKNGMVGDFSRKAIEAVRRAPAGSLVTIVRCYRTEAETAEQVEELFPGLDPQIITAYSARKSPAHSALTVVMQADALFDRSDFRADEKALQLLTMLKSRTDRLVVQTGAASHPVFEALCSVSSENLLLEERRQFSLPPFSRIVDVYDISTGELKSHATLARDRNLSQRKKELLAQFAKSSWFDVDPV